MKTSKDALDEIYQEMKSYQRLVKLEKRIMSKTVNKAKKIARLVVHFPKNGKELYAEKLARAKRTIKIHHEE